MYWVPTLSTPQTKFGALGTVYYTCSSSIILAVSRSITLAVSSSNILAVSRSIRQP